MTSTIKVNNIQNQCGQNIINENSNTITIGASGDTIALASGASQTGFGRTGTVDWQTGSIKTTGFTAVSGQGFFCDTNGGGFTCTLPSGVAGAIVSLQDYRNTFDTGALSVNPQSGEKINGGAAGAGVSLTTEGEGITLVYIDSTVGWRSIQDNDFAAAGSNFVSATGGTESQTGDFKIHKFTGPGTFTITAGGSPAGSNTLEYLVVGGGGAGGPASPSNGAGGGGAGGYRESNGLTAGSYTVSPLATTPTTVPGLTASVGSFSVQVGGGGPATPSAPGTNVQNNGTPSVFSTVTSTGGGAGGIGQPLATYVGQPGGSGGGGGGYCAASNPGGTGNTPPVTPPQGSSGGIGSPSSAPSYFRGGGGGGALNVGNAASANANGGGGATSSIDGTPTVRAGGGGGGCTSTPAGFAKGSGGAGGGGAGGGQPTNAVAGTVNTGGGGGGGGYPNSYQAGAAGGSGIVIIRYKFQ
jgi:hypothetical protein